MSAAPPNYAESTANMSDKSYVKLAYNHSLLQLSSFTEFKDDTRTPIDLIAVIDVSSSMNTELDGVLECKGFTRMDIVKHGMNMILTNLSSNDSLTIITFSVEARVVLPRCYLSRDNVELARARLASILCCGNTNLYDGLQTAYSYLRKNPLARSAEEFVNRHIMLLTDGAPNSSPNNLNATNFQLYQNLLDKEFAASSVCKQTLLHMFGITHNELEDKLLGKIAKYGHGMYSFISNPEIITPCFINILAQWFHMLFTGLILQVHQEGQNEKEIFIPWVLQGGTVDFAFNNSLNQPASFTLTSNMARRMRLQVTQKLDSMDKAMELFKLRQSVAERLLLLTDPKSAQKKSEYIVNMLSQYKPVTEWSKKEREWLDLLRYDVDIYNRIKPESLLLWAEKCLYSLALSLQDDYVSNGYEKSYKSKTDARLLYWIEQVENVARNITVPNPSIKAYKGGVQIRSQAQQQAPSYYAPSSSQYNNSSYFSSSSGYDMDQGCIDGECLVDMADGSRKKVKDVTIGDQVLTDGGFRIVRCSILVPSDQLIELPGGLRITAMHPIWYKDWILPCDHPDGKVISLKPPLDMYSFLLEPKEAGDIESNAMRINDYFVVHFSHNSKHKVLQHDFYGSENMRQTVERLDPERKGKIRVTVALRNAKNEVCDYEGYAFFS